MKRIRDTDRVREAPDQALTVGLREISGNNTDPRKPPRRLGIEPRTEVLAGVSRDHVNDDAPLKVDQSGRKQRRVILVCGEPGRLINAEHRNRSNPPRIVDEGLAVLCDRTHHGVPAHPELSCHLRNRPGVRSNLAACLLPGTIRQHAPRRELSDVSVHVRASHNGSSQRRYRPC